MVNITRSGDSVLVTSFDNSQFPWSDGELSIPLNSMYFILEDETDFIVFKSVYDDSIMFTALIDEIHVNDVKVTRDTIIELVDNVINSNGGGGSASAGVNSINGFQGDVNIKSINGESLIGSGDITIEGGGDVDLSDYYNKEELNYVLTTTYQNYNGYDQIITKGGNTLNIAQINGESILGKKQSITLPTNSDLDSMVTNVAVMGGDRIAVIQKNGNIPQEIYFPTINGQQILGVEGDITIEGGSSGSETDPIFEAWKNDSNIIAGSGTTNTGDYVVNLGWGGATTANGAICISNRGRSGSNCIAIGVLAQSTTPNSISIGYNTSSTAKYAIAIGNGAKCFDSEGSIAIGNGVQTDSTYKINIGDTFKGDTSNYAYVLNEYGNYVRIPTEWTGTQSEYDALGTYYDNITYNIIEG